MGSGLDWRFWCSLQGDAGSFRVVSRKNGWFWFGFPRRCVGGGGLGSSVVVHFPHYLCALLGILLGPSGCTPILKYSTPGDGCCPMDGETFYRAEKQTTDIHRLAEGQPSAKSHSLPGHGHPDTVLVVLVHWTKDSGDEPEFLAELRSMPSSAPERPAVSSQKHEIWQLKILHFSPELIH